MSKIAKIECPKCKKTIVVDYVDGIETKSIICPNCHIKSKILNCNYELVDKVEETTVSTSWYRPTECVGDLVYDNGNSIEVFHLTEGINIIGRKSNAKTNASILVNDDEKVISREHFKIEVVKTDGTIVEHRLSLVKAGVNDTTLNGAILYEEDIIVLNFDDVIRCKGKSFKFLNPLQK